MTEIQAVIFDVDGTLVDSNDAHAHAWVEALAAHGYSAAFAEVRPLVGMGGDKLLPKVAGIELDSEEGKAVDVDRGRAFKERYLPGLHAFPGVRELLLRLREAGRTLLVASSAKDDELQPLLALTGASEVFAATTSASEAPRSKPDPDIVQAALRRSGCPPAEVALVGDTPYDVAAGQRAGVAVVGVRCGGWDAAALHGAVAVYADPADLLAHLSASPLLR